MRATLVPGLRSKSRAAASRRPPLVGATTASPMGMSSWLGLPPLLKALAVPGVG